MYIELQNAVKIYKTQEVETTALNKISLGIQKGEMAAVVGTSGSGKSTLLNILGGMDRLTQGNYFFDGENVAEYTARKLHEFRKRNVGFVFQNFELMNQYNAYENIEMPLLIRNVKDRRKRVMEYMERLGIARLGKKYPEQLSGGEKQRVAIARAFVSEPELILADEPTGALDQRTGAEVMKILEQMNESGKTILVVTHDMEIAKRCKKIIKLEDGKIALD